MTLNMTAAAMIITKGLGGPACCSLLSADFGLVCGCVISVFTPGNPGGGWAQYPMRNIPGVPKGSAYYTPAPRKYGAEQRLVVVKIRLANKTWETTYLVEKDIADIIIKITNLFNAAQAKVRVVWTNVKRAAVQGLNPVRTAISGLKQTYLKVTAMFKTDDK